VFHHHHSQIHRDSHAWTSPRYKQGSCSILYPTTSGLFQSYMGPQVVEQVLLVLFRLQ
jgi:hypothetical protein